MSLLALAGTSAHAQFAQHGQDWGPQKSGTWYVSAAAPAGGDGTRQKPFNLLFQAQAWSGPGDTITILPSPIATPPLDGGIRLKPGQTLIGEGPSVTGGVLTAAPRITNKSNFDNNGDGVVLADNSSVKNIVITGTYRSGIYGSDVTGVQVLGNDISAQNQSCATGIHIFPFYTLLFSGIPNGWAGIMIDSASGRGEGKIDGNNVHDAACGDGIDVRLMGTAFFDATVTNNKVAHLKEGTAQGLHSVLAIGMQTGDASELKETIDNNNEADIGSPNSDPEGVFVNMGGASHADVAINHNIEDNVHGGPSANGMEFVMSERAAKLHMKIENSSFTNVTGDILEAVTWGQNQTADLEMDHVTASHARLVTPNPSFDLQSQKSFFNRAACFDLSNVGPSFLGAGDNAMTVKIRNSNFTDCEVGVLIGAQRSQALTSLEIDDSSITANGAANLYVKNSEPITAAMAAQEPAASGAAIFANDTPTPGVMGRLDVKVRNSRLAGATHGPDIYVYAVPGTVRSGSIDLGNASPAFGGQGNNDLAGKPLIQASGVVVHANGNWWGHAGGPDKSDILLQNGAVVEANAPLGAAPAKPK